jgi:hypothetical protein
MIDSLKFIRNLSWAELVEIWKNKEADVWSDYINENGLKDWEDYRFGPMGTITRYGYDEFNLSDQEWKEYQMPDVHMIAPRLYTGPFRSWTKYNSSNPNASQPFIQAIQDPELRNNKDIQWTRNSLLGGRASFGIGLHEPEKDVISLLDGHHTFSALNMLVEEGYKGPLPEIPLYLVTVPEGKRDYFYDLIEGRTEPIRFA